MIEEHPLLLKETPYHIIERNPLLYKETPYYGRKAFLYYRRTSLTNKEHIQGNPFLQEEIPYYRMKSLAIEQIPSHRRNPLTIEGNAL